LGGGGGVVMAALATELARRHAVTVLTSRALGLPAESMEAGVHVVRVPVFFRRQLAVANMASMAAFLPMGALRGLTLRRGGRNFDVVNTHFVVPSGPVGQLLSAFYGVPNVLSVHGGDLYDPSKKSSPHRHAWLRAAIRRLLVSAQCVVGQSSDTLRHVEHFYAVRRETELIPLGIARPRSTAPAAREELGLRTSDFVMVTVGRLVARKSTVQLVQALSMCSRPSAHLVVIGDGPDADGLRSAAVQAGVGDRVHLLGHVTDDRKERVLSCADIFVSASQHEGFGLVFLEAMAFGLPVVCYDRGGHTDFLRTGETGVVVPLNDVRALAAAMAQLHEGGEQRRQIGRRNKRLVEDYFIDRCAERYESVFEAVIRKGLSNNSCAA